ncbi:MAG: hypothetical protein WC755_01095 [Candidatus Woesearchaeota archaeon]|jgi:hypothetical protein
MAIVSISYNKIHAEKSKKHNNGQVSIKNNVAITNVSYGASNHTSQKAIIFEFSFSITYEPQVGVITIEGAVIDIEEEKKAKEIVDMWEKEKRIERDLTARVISIVIEKGYIKGILISQDLGLPSPVPLPKVRMDGGNNANASKKEEKHEEKKEEPKKNNANNNKKK